MIDDKKSNTLFYKSQSQYVTFKVYNKQLKYIEEISILWSTFLQIIQQNYNDVYLKNKEKILLYNFYSDRKSVLNYYK